jgi:hypothetical protein
MAFDADYKKALSLSLEFYDAQGAGARSEAWRKVAWRKSATLNDGSDVGVDLSGGWYDAGDHVKFGTPMAYSAAMLGWAYLEYQSGFEEAGETQYFLDNLRFVNDYFLQASSHIDLGRFYYQVADGDLDHAYWMPPELLTYNRETFSCNTMQRCSEVTADTAAALAVASMVFKDTDAAYATTLLNSAIKLYAFATDYPGNNGYTAVKGYYRSYSGYDDELAWASVWLYKATGESGYLERAKAYVEKAQSAIYWAHNWDNVSNGTYLLLAKAGDSDAKNKIETHLNYWLNGITYTSGGLAFLNEWGSLRYSSTTAFLALMYSDFASDMTKKSLYRTFAVQQIGYILGNNPTGQSFLIGYGTNYPKNPHHRAAHNSSTNNIASPDENEFTLNGALVGGPKVASDFDYKDDRSDYYRNEVATDYNAGLVGALARLVTLNATPEDVAPGTGDADPEEEESGTGHLSFSRYKTVTWDGGYCEKATLINTTGLPVQWRVELGGNESFFNVENAVLKIEGDKFYASGTQYNRTIFPDGKIEFNYCIGSDPDLDELDDLAEEQADRDKGDDKRVETEGQAVYEREIIAAWEQGYCEKITVRNTGKEAYEWRADFDVNGTIYDSWNGRFSQEGNRIGITGLEWNKVLQAGQSSEIGFCSNRSLNTQVISDQLNKQVEEQLTDASTCVKNSGGLEATVVTANDWGTGYCSDIVISSTNANLTEWMLPLTFEGTIYNIWNARYEDGNFTADAEWNRYINVDKTASFGFCANR